MTQIEMGDQSTDFQCNDSANQLRAFDSRFGDSKFGFVSKKSSVPQFGHVASRNGKGDGEITTEFPQVGHSFGQPSGVRDETFIGAQGR
ncbi:MAG: hypothetical protein AAGG48_28500 [Planctomycetota bacterium]